MFITQAFADGAAQQSSGWMSFLPMIFFIAILYFLLIRPQQKKQKQHQSLLASIKKGDRVITNSGIIATISKILNDQEIILEIATGVHCKFLKSSIVSVFNKDAENNAPEKIITEEKTQSENIVKKEAVKNESPVVQKKMVKKPAVSIDKKKPVNKT